MLSAVEDSSPNRMTIAIGAWISLPGLPPPKRQRNQRQAGRQRGHQDRHQPFDAPRYDRLAEVGHAFLVLQVLMCDTSMMPLRVAMPNSVMKPTIDATDSTPPDEIDARPRRRSAPAAG